MQIKKNKYLIPVLIFFINIFIKSLFINSRDIALDEPFSIYYGQMDYHSIIQMLYNENNPPLHFFILHCFIKLFGVGPIAVRLPSLIFSSFTAIFIYLIGNRFFSRLVGMGTSLIFTFSTTHIFFSHEARVYPIFSMIVAILLYFYLKIAADPINRKNYFWLFVFNTILIYCHYFGFFILFMEIFSLLLLPQWNKIFKSLLLIQLLTAVCYIPIIFIFIHRLRESTTKGTWVASPHFSEFYKYLLGFLNGFNNVKVLVLLFIIAFVFLLKQKKTIEKISCIFNNSNFRIIFIWFALPYIIMYLISYKYPIFIDRYIVYTSIPMYLVIIILLEHVFEKKIFSKIAITLFIISCVCHLNLNPDNNRRLREVVKLVKILKSPTTITLLAPDYAYMSFAYHYNINYFKQAPQTMQLLIKDNVTPLSDKEIALKTIENKKIKKQLPSCIYIQAGSEFIDPTNAILRAIESRYKIHKTFHVYEIYDIHYFYN